MTTTPWDVRDALVAQIKDITPQSAYQQTTADDWRESFDVIVEGQPANRANLAFWVDDGLVDQQGMHRNNVAEGAFVTAPVDVVFLYRLRPRNEGADWNASSRAALHLIQTLTAWDDAEIDVEISPRPIQREPAPEPQWLRVIVAFTVRYQLDLDPA